MSAKTLKSAFFILWITFSSIHQIYGASGYKNTVAYAGITFMGEKDTDFSNLYPYSYALVKQLELNKKTFGLLQTYAPKNFNVSPVPLDRSSGHKYALALMIDDEYIAVETVQTYNETLYKAVPYISAQLVFFDVEKSQFVSAIYLPPISMKRAFFKQYPTEQQKSALIAKLMSSDEDNGLLQHFITAVKDAKKLQRSKLFTFAVSAVEVQDKAQFPLPSMYKEDKNRRFKNYIAHKIIKNLSNTHKVATQPYSVDASTLTMRGRFTGSDNIYNIALPSPAFTVEYTLQGFKTVTHNNQKSIARTDIYAAFSTLRILKNTRKPKVIFEQSFKSGVTKIIPEGKQVIDEWSVYREALLTLLHNTFTNLHNTKSDFYLSNKFDNKDKKQIKKLEEAYEKCVL